VVAAIRRSFMADSILGQPSQRIERRGYSASLDRCAGAREGATAEAIANWARSLARSARRGVIRYSRRHGFVSARIAGGSGRRPQRSAELRVRCGQPLKNIRPAICTKVLKRLDRRQPPRRPADEVFGRSKFACWQHGRRYLICIGGRVARRLARAEDRIESAARSANGANSLPDGCHVRTRWLEEVKSLLASGRAKMQNLRFHRLS